MDDKPPTLKQEIQYFLNVTLRLPVWLTHPIDTAQEWWHMRPFKPGVIYHACNLHPCVATKVDKRRYQYAIEGISLLDGSGPHACSLTSCGVFIMQQDEIDLYIRAWKAKGAEGILEVWEGQYDDVTKIPC